MTVQIALDGFSDMDILAGAINEMGFSPKKSNDRSVQVQGVAVDLHVTVKGQTIGFVQDDQTGQIRMVGDSDYRVMNSRKFKENLQQHYSLSAVKRKIKELRYNTESVSTLADGSIRVVARAWG